MKESIRVLFIILIQLISIGLPLLIPSLHSKLLIPFFITWLLSKPNFEELRTPWLILFGSLLLIAIIGVAYSDNITYSLGYLENHLTLILLPVLIFSSATLLKKKGVVKIIEAFVIGVIALNLLSLFFISYNLWDFKNMQSNLIVANNVIVKIHPAFLSLYISFCIFFLVDQYFPLKSLNRTRLGWVVFSLAILLVFLFWLNSRVGILAFLMSSVFFFSSKRIGKVRTIGFAGLILFLLLIIIIPFSRYRFIEAPLMVLKGDTSGALEDPSVYTLVTRLQIYRSDLELLKWPEIVYGYGTGDFRHVLQERFSENGFERPLTENMDSHCEYFAQLHRHGIIGVTLFLALLIVPFRHAMKHRSPLLGAFIIMFAFTALFENVFSTQKGVVFFALFCPLLWIYAEQQVETRKTQTSIS